MSSPAADERARARRVAKLLADSYPDAWCALRHENAWQLLVATILAAQCTDERVNMVTPELFAAYPDPASLAAADPEALETMIHSTGFFRQKTKSLRAVASAVTNEFSGGLPRDLDTLVKLPGIGRKTATALAYGLLVGASLTIPTGARPWTVVAAFAFGLGFNSIPTLLAVRITNYVDSSGFGAAFGVATIGFGAGLMIGPQLGGVIGDARNSFALVFYLAAAAAAVGGALAIRR